jgi:hypothetical protein
MSGASVAMSDRLDSLPTTSLDAIESTSALQRRIDRKYVVSPGQLDAMLELIADGSRVLEIDGARRFRYESMYFDTATFESYFGAARRRPDRFKIRTRTYVDTGSSWFEIKLRSCRGHTIKHRRSHDVGRRDHLTAESIEFLTAFPQTRRLASELRPVLRTSYERATLVHGDQRITIDWSLACAPIGAVDHEGVGIGESVIVETKSEGHPGAADRALWALGTRPVAISKFAIGLASAHSELPANKWHRTMLRHVRPIVGIS